MKEKLMKKRTQIRQKTTNENNIKNVNLVQMLL